MTDVVFSSFFDELEKIAKRGLWDNIHAKRRRIAAGSGERMRRPGAKGAPTRKALEQSKTASSAKAMDQTSRDILKSTSKSVTQAGKSFRTSQMTNATKTKAQAKVLTKRAGIVYRGVTFPGYNKPIASNRKGKKKMVLVKKGGKVKLVHFGQKGYQDFTQHKDPKRRENYLKRSGGIRGKGGKLTANDPFSANYWARKELW